MKNNTVKLLSEVEKSAAFGRDSVTSVLKHVDQPALRRELERSRREYAHVCEAAKNSLTQMGQRAGSNPQSLKMMVRTAVNSKLNRRRDPSAAAKMTIQGCTMGNVEILRALHENPSASEHAKKIAQQAVAEQERSIDSMKPFL